MTKRDLFRKHAGSIGKAAEGGAVAAGYSWWYFLAIFAVILVGVWAVALWIGSWIALALAVAATMSIVPPLVKEWKHRDEVRRTMGRKP